MAEAEAEAWCVIGDLSALYDLAAVWVLPQLTPGNRRFVVINNGGGKIFRGLGALQGAEEKTLAMMENPHGLRFEAWAEMFGMGYRQVTSASELGDLPDGDVVVEIVIED
jgi:2-succinyl-5-enolpyruvyl-6-hydroxy-3-cyclohexene-1-carboxylate synthase